MFAPRLLAINDRFHALVEMGLCPTGIRALRYQRPLSVSAFALTSRLARLGLSPTTLVDVGANRGQFLAAALFQWPSLTVHAFEPLPLEGTELQAKFRQAANVTIHRSALGDEEGFANLHRHASSLSSSLLPSTKTAQQRFDWAVENDTVEVPVQRLDAALSADLIRPPALLKIDVQGYESRVLAGASGILSRFNSILVEHSFEPFYEGQPTISNTMTDLIASGWILARVISTRSEEGVPVEADCLYIPANSGDVSLIAE